MARPNPPMATPTYTRVSSPRSRSCFASPTPTAPSSLSTRARAPWYGQHRSRCAHRSAAAPPRRSATPPPRRSAAAPPRRLAACRATCRATCRAAYHLAPALAPRHALGGPAPGLPHITPLPSGRTWPLPPSLTPSCLRGRCGSTAAPLHQARCSLVRCTTTVAQASSAADRLARG